MNERVRRIINSTYITLDGVIQNPQDWPLLGGFSEAGAQVQGELLARCDAVLMGRHTYDGFAPVWSARSGDPFSDRMNALRKYVVSTTLTDPDWHNTTVIDGDPVEAVRDLTHGRGTAGRAPALGAPLLRRHRHSRRPDPPSRIRRPLRPRRLHQPRHRHRDPHLPELGHRH
jgi:hypothetical protein